MTTKLHFSTKRSDHKTGQWVERMSLARYIFKGEVSAKAITEEKGRVVIGQTYVRQAHTRTANLAVPSSLLANA